MLYLLGVVIIALVYGRWPSVLATVINVISFDLFCRPARDAGGVGCPVSAHLRRDAHRGPAYRQPHRRRALPARVARYRERRTRHLYEMSKALAVGRSQQDIATTSERFIASTFQARSQLLLPDAQWKTAALNPPAVADPVG